MKHPINGFHKIDFTDDPKTIYLDATTLEQDTQDVQEKYGLPASGRLTE